MIGAGTAGSASAVLLARGGHEVTLFERVADPQPVGAGITLQPTGQAVLAALGLLGPVEERGARLERLTCRTRRGRVVVDLPYAALDPDLHGLGLHRGVLFETLLAAAQAEPGVTVRTGVGIETLQRRGDERALVDRAGAEHGPFDLVVVADGAVSELHDDTRLRRRVRPYPWGALWFVADDPDGALQRQVDQVVDGARRMCGLLPTGRAPRGDRPVVSLFWSLRADRVEAWRARGLEAWKEEVVALHPRAAPVVAQLEAPEQVLFTQYRDVAMPRWHEPRLVFIGDAAHATSPQLGQGANLALWDALVLAECAAEARGVDDALAAYTAARRRHLDFYQFATRALTPLFQADSRLLGWARDLVFPLAGALPPIRRRMVRTMAGIDRGIVRRPIPLPELKARLLPASSGR